MSSTSTPMGRLSHNLKILKEQLNENFNIIELQAKKSKSYKNIETKEIKSDYILLFVNKYNISINFSFAFWYKELIEDNWVIDVTTKNSDSKIVIIKQLCYNKFKEVLNSLVRLNIDSNNIFDYILLLKNIKDEWVDGREKHNELILSELNQNISEKLELKNDLVKLSNKITDKIQEYFNIVENSELYKENCRLRKELDDSNNKLLEFRKITFDKLEIKQIVQTLDKKEGLYNYSLNSLYEKFSQKVDKSLKNKITHIIQDNKFIIPKFRLPLYQLKCGSINNYSGHGER